MIIGMKPKVALHVPNCISKVTRGTVTQKGGHTQLSYIWDGGTFRGRGSKIHQILQNLKTDVTTNISRNTFENIFYDTEKNKILCTTHTYDRISKTVFPSYVSEQCDLIFFYDVDHSTSEQFNERYLRDSILYKDYGKGKIFIFTDKIDLVKFDGAIVIVAEQTSKNLESTCSELIVISEDLTIVNFNDETVSINKNIVKNDKLGFIGHDIFIGALIHYYAVTNSLKKSITIAHKALELANKFEFEDTITLSHKAELDKMI